MSTPQDDRFTGVAELPPYKALLVVDLKNYSGNPSRYQPQLKDLVPEIMRSAFDRCGLAAIWSQASFPDTTGDGYCIGLPPTTLPFLLNPYLEALQEELEERNRRLPRVGPEPMRLRVSLHVGPVTDSGADELSDGAGAPRIELHRLLDSDPVRGLLSRSADVTCVAAIVSDRVYEDAVRSGYADEDPALYVDVPVTVKTYQGRAYLRVPKPSGGLLTQGFREADRSTDAIAQAGDDTDEKPGSSGPHVQDNSRHRRGGVGTIAGNVGSVVTDPTGPVHTGTGHLYFSKPGGHGDDR